MSIMSASIGANVDVKLGTEEAQTLPPSNEAYRGGPVSEDTGGGTSTLLPQPDDDDSRTSHRLR
jgi:hypothetical protein